MKKLIPVILSLILTGCFEYQEVLVFSPDFSGYVDVEYMVPAYDEYDKSMLAFLPITKKEIEQRFSRTSGRPKSIENFQLEFIKNPDRVDAYSRLAHVKYRIRFANPFELDKILLGKTTLFWRDGRLILQRNFPSGKSLGDQAGRIARHIRTLSFSKLSGKTIRFQTIFPWYFDLITNRGSFTKPGSHFYSLPLESTLNSGNQIVWNLEIKPNPRPEASP